MNVASPFTLEPGTIEIDSRPCKFCGRPIDQHHCIDEGEDPEVFCWDEDDIVKCWELADPRDAWKHTGAPPPPKHLRNSDISARPADQPRPYRTPQSTIDAFSYVVSLGDSNRLARWLANHPADARHLFKIWKAKLCS
jgi:hypothetical protein